MMLARDLVQLYRMREHAEHGSFLERHYQDGSGRRPLSGSIYYYLAPEERADFHVLDCDEYWSYHSGSPLELWLMDAAGQVSRSVLGLGRGAEPLIYIPGGTVFGARHFSGAEDGTFVSCVTVPRYQEAGWRLYSQEEAVTKWPRLAEFYKENKHGG